MTLKIFGAKGELENRSQFFRGIELKMEVNQSCFKEMKAYFSKKFHLLRLIYSKKYALFKIFRLQRAYHLT